MICPFCQSESPAQAQFCLVCGVELGAVVKSASQNAPTSGDALPNGTLLASTYAVERVLGQGGFGITYCCHDQMLDRRVAIKEFFPAGCVRDGANVLPSRKLTGAHFSEARAQFLAEARLLARCHHVGIVGVHTAFEANSTAYMVMEMLHGRDLAQLLQARGGRLSEGEAVPLIERAGEALQFVHETGLLHRDIKPENIIVCDNGRVMLIDFGTAREYIKGQAQGHTIVVTPGYAPLEQYARQAQRGAFTDVYGLAATLYHLLTGNAPPAASDRAMGVRLRPVREENSQVSLSVAHATEAALQMEIARRPQSVREFLELMRAPASHAIAKEATQKVVLAPEKPEKPDSDDAEEARKIATYASPLFFSTALDARQQMLDAMLPDPSPVQLAPSTPFPKPISPSAAVPSATPVQFPGVSSPNASGGILNRNVSPPDNSLQWGVAVALLAFIGLLGLVAFNSPRTTTTYNPPNAIISGSGTTINNSWSPNSQPSTPSFQPSREISRPETAARREIENMPAILPVSVETLPVSAETGKTQTNTTINGSAAYSSNYSRGLAEFSPGGDLVAYVDAKFVVRVWSLSKGRVVSSLPPKSNAPRYIHFSPDGKNLILTRSTLQDGRGGNNEVSVWNLATEKSLGRLSVDPQKEWLASHAMLPDGKVIISKSNVGENQQRYFLWDPRTGKRIAAPMKPSADVLDQIFPAGGQPIVTGDKSGQVRWFDARTGAQKAEHSTSVSGSGSIVALRLSFNGSYLASNNTRQTSIFDSKAQEQEVAVLDTGYSAQFAVSNDGKFLAESSSRGSETRNTLWNVREKQKIRLQSPPGSLGALSFSPDGKQVIGISNSPDGRASLVTWNVDAKPMAPFSAPQTGISLSNLDSSAGAVSVKSQLIATSDGSDIETYNFDGNLLYSANAGGNVNSYITLSPDGSLLSFGLRSGETRVLNAKTGRLVGQLKSAVPSLPAIRQSPPTGKKTLSLKARRSFIHFHHIFASDNSLLARAVDTEKVKLVELWSLKNEPRLLFSLPVTEAVSAMTFSADNKSLICGGPQGLVSWYDVATQKLRGQIQGNSNDNSGDVLQLVATAQNLTTVTQSRTKFSQSVIARIYDVRTMEKRSGTSSSPEALKFPLKKESQIGASWDFGFQKFTTISPDGQFLVIRTDTQGNINSEGGLAVWDIATGVLVQRLPFESSSGGTSVDFMSSIRAISVSPDFNEVTCIREDQTNRQSQIISWKRPAAQTN